MGWIYGMDFHCFGLMMVKTWYTSDYNISLNAYVYFMLNESDTIVDLLCYVELVSGILSYNSKITYELEWILNLFYFKGQNWVWVPLEKRKGKDREC